MEGEIAIPDKGLRSPKKFFFLFEKESWKKKLSIN